MRSRTFVFPAEQAGGLRLVRRYYEVVEDKAVRTGSKRGRGVSATRTGIIPRSAQSP